MDGGNEQRDAIKICMKAGLSASETLVLVHKANGNEASNLSKLFRRYSRFRERRELVDVDERGGRPKWTRTEVYIAAVAVWSHMTVDRIKKDSRIFERHRGCSSSDSERGLGKEKVVCTFCSTVLDT